MKNIYILLTATGTSFARFIRAVSNAPYSHVSISLDKECEQLYSFSRTYTNNPFLGSFQHEKIEEKVFGKYRNIPCEMFEIEVTDTQYKDVKKTIDSMKGKKYNKLGLLCKLLHIPYHRKTCYFCSEFVAYTLESNNIYSFNKPLNYVEPIDFLTIPKKKLVYQGNLHNMLKK